MARWSIWACSWTSFTRLVAGSPSTASASARAGTTPAQFLMDNPDLADELEEKIRAQMFHLNGRAAPAAPAASPAEPAGFAAPERPMPQGVSITADDFNDED